MIFWELYAIFHCQSLYPLGFVENCIHSPTLIYLILFGIIIICFASWHNLNGSQENKVVHLRLNSIYPPQCMPEKFENNFLLITFCQYINTNLHFHSCFFKILYSFKVKLVVIYLTMRRVWMWRLSTNLFPFYTLSFSELTINTSKIYKGNEWENKLICLHHVVRKWRCFFCSEY